MLFVVQLGIALINSVTPPQVRSDPSGFFALSLCGVSTQNVVPGCQAWKIFSSEEPYKKLWRSLPNPPCGPTLYICLWIKSPKPISSCSCRMFVFVLIWSNAPQGQALRRRNNNRFASGISVENRPIFLSGILFAKKKKKKARPPDTLYYLDALICCL